MTLGNAHLHPVRTAVVALAAWIALGGPALGAEPLVLPGLDGGELSETELAAGPPVILVLWAAGSPECRGIVARINEIATEWSGAARVVSVVPGEDGDTVGAFLADRKLRVPVYLDATGALTKKHRATELPGLLMFVDGSPAFAGKLPPNPDPIIRSLLN